MSDRNALYAFTFSGSEDYTLTTTAGGVASSALYVPYAQRIVIYPYYTAGAATTTNTLTIIIETNPYKPEEDTADAYWSQYGIWTDSSGTWSEEAATYVSDAGTASTTVGVTPIELDIFNAQQIRVRLKETQNQAVAGTARVLAAISNDM